MATAGDIRAGGAFLEVTATTDKLKAALGQADKQLRDFGNRARGWSLGTAAAIGAGFFAAKAAVAGAMNALVSYGDHFDKMSQRTGISTEALGEFEHMAGLCGTSIETFEVGIRTLQKTQYDATNGSADLAKSFATIGVSLDDLRTKSPEDQFRTVAAALADVEDPVKRNAIAMKLLGDSGTQLMPLFNAGADGMEEMAQEAHDLGLVMSGEESAAAAKLADEISKVKSSLFGTTRAILSEMVPTFSRMATVFSNSIKKIIDFTREHKALTAGLTKGTLAFIGVTGAIIGAAKAFQMLSSAAAVLSMNPTTLGLLAVAAAAVGIYSAFKKASDASYDLSDAQAKVAQSNKELRTTHNDYFAKLEEIAGKQNKTNDEINKAAYYAEALNSAYGGLGITVDTTTGKIEGLGEAFKKMNETQKAQRIADLKAEVLEQETNIEKMKSQKEGIFNGWTSKDFLPGFSVEYQDRYMADPENHKECVEEGGAVKNDVTGRWALLTRGNKEKWESLSNEIEVLEEQKKSREEVLRQLENGFDVEEAETEAQGASSGISSGANEKTTSKDRIDEYNRQFDKRNFTEHQKKIDEINSRYESLLKERVKELQQEGYSKDEAREAAEGEEGLTKARENRDTLIQEENTAYEKKKAEGISKEIEEYNRQFKERNFTEHEKRIAEIEKEYAELVKKRKTELVDVEGLSEAEAQNRIESDPELEAARQSRDARISEENTNYEKEKAEGVSKEIEEYNRQFKERNFTEYEKRIAEIEKAYEELVNKRKAELVDVEGLSEAEAQNRIESDPELETARQNRDALIEEQKAAETKERETRRREYTTTKAEQRRDELNEIESTLQIKLRDAIVESHKSGNTNDVVNIVNEISKINRERQENEKEIKFEELNEAAERLKEAEINLAAALESGDEKKIEEARNERAEAAGNLESARSSAAAVSEEILSSMANQADQMANEVNAGITAAEVKFSSVGTFSAFESSRLDNNYEKKIADYNFEQVRLQREMTYLLQNSNNSSAAVFA